MKTNEPSSSKLKSKLHHSTSRDSSTFIKSTDSDSDSGSGSDSFDDQFHSSTFQNHPLQITSDKWIPIIGKPINNNQPQPSTSNANSHSHPSRSSVTVKEPQDLDSVPLFEDDDSIEYVKVDEKISIYVECFQSMLETVLEREHYLFDHHESNLLNSWNTLTYSAKYLFVRLFMRKHDKWFRIDKLKNYELEIDNVHEACLQLAQLNPKSNSTQPTSPNPILEDLTFNMDLDDQIDIKSDMIDPMLLNPSSSISHCNAIRKISENLSTNLIDQAFKSLDFQTHAILPILPPIPQAVPILGPHLIPYLSFANPSKTNPEELLNCLSLIELKSLAKSLKINFHTTRDMIIKGLLESSKNQSTLVMGFKKNGKKEDNGFGLKFDSRGRKERQSEMLSSKVLGIIGDCIKLDPEVCTLFSRLHLIYYRSRTVTEKTMTAATLARFKLRTYPTYHVTRTSSIFESRDSLIKYERALLMEKEMEDCLNGASYVGSQREPKRVMVDKVEEKEKRKTEKDRRMKKGEEIFRRAWIEWQEALKEEDQRIELDRANRRDEDPMRYYRRQFYPGHPLTRIVYKATEILSYYKNYEGEIEILITLLKQKHFRRGKRGAWYERLALVLMTHFEGRHETALRVCEEGLNDPDTHEIYYLSLRRRLIRLKKSLGINQFSVEEWKVMNSSKNWCRKTLSGNRIEDGREIGRKSKWNSTRNPWEEVSVEEFVLEKYCEDENWKGFHSEGSILTTLYSLIFWDVIFAPVPGVFETSYQSAPLDLFTDAFAIVRSNLIKETIESFQKEGIGKIKETLIKTYERESEKKTWCIGIHWERYGMNELLEILECLGCLEICKLLKVLSEEYGFRKGGVPDLCLWNHKEKKVLFVEVKGPGDRLSETQIAWLDLLRIGIGCEVEVCEVKEDEDQVFR
ncbi:uncharacterized protein MELLADRAFT_103952 [Melampsora larici-populina 98AG31]|uniref:Fanconi-associated nuclease n=1 Tax=Melampsora larici-populina (strain 98AG31 / pathotype 3-4-7) TaxID=747676 RepID=F4RD39_MELLP|nr:uncharacterized protein MELLADRAFT_103952 [Melampsora larici-populina 98AG31]EGG09831.1 hypothetical protein MELLADRAFT_103952 [Melampsora larici-populina 98AG31]